MNSFGPPPPVVHVDPVRVVAKTSMVILDVRARNERFGQVGFIPGSRSFPEEEFDEGLFVLCDELAPESEVVLACLSGRRSAQLVERVRSVGFRTVYNLRGGVLAWAAEYPLCGLQTPAFTPPTFRTPTEVRRSLASCFVAESVENRLQRGLAINDFDPKALVEQVAERAFKLHADNPRDALVAFLDRLGELARRSGHPLPTIVKNVDLMLTMIDAADPDAAHWSRREER